MANILRAASASEPDQHATDGWRARDIPSGLASLIVHFLVMIVLGLLYVDQPAPLEVLEVNFQVDDLGDGELEGGSFGDSNESGESPSMTEIEAETTLPSVLADMPPLEAPEPLPPSLSLEVPDASKFLLDDVALGANGLHDPALRGGSGDGGGHGRGHGRGRGNGHGDGTSSRTSMFGLSEEGGRIVYVFDRSESMNSVFTLVSGAQSTSITPVDAAKAELMRSLGDLSDGSEFGIIFYNLYPAAFPDPLAKNGVSRATPDTRALAQSFVYGMIAEAGTAHVPALTMAIQLQPDVIYLLTDGEEKDDPSNADVRTFEKMCRGAGTRITVIHFCVKPRTATTLRSLAEETGGQFKTVTFRSLLEPLLSTAR